MTFDDWSGGVVKPLMDRHPYAIVFFLAFILLSTFVALNLFIGVVVTAIDAETERDAPKLTHPAHETAAILAEIRALRVEVASLRSQDEVDGSSPEPSDRVIPLPERQPVRP
jgi:voltage-gated sodium channel